MIKKLLTLVLLVLTVATYAQKPILSPLPQKVTWGEEVSNATISNLIEGIRGDETVAAYEDLIPNTKDGYYLKLSSEGAVLAGHDERGLFYAHKTLNQLLGTDRTNAGHGTAVYACEIQDWPVVADRGVVEGFYGNPWTHEARKRMFDFLADNKMNMYIYGPKDDPYHWGKWSELYPAKELNELEELVQYAAEKKVKFVWAVHTGQSLTEEQYTQLYKKFEQLYNIGVRVFGMFYDDAYGNGATQATMLNRMTESFLNTHEGCEPFICCPAVYCGTFYGMGDANYLPDMCSMTRDADVKIMWTGSGVMDMQLGNSVQNFINSYGVKPFIWHNWPVNDYSRAHLFMGKTDGLDNQLYKKICGFTANPMEYPEASKVTVYSVADYLWNMAAYNPDKSWQQAWQYLYPQHGEEFGLFCQNSVNPGSNRINRPGESQYFLDALKAGTSEHQLYTDIYEAATALLADDSDPAVSEEMEPWLKAMRITGQRGMALQTLEDALDTQDPELFISTYQQMKAWEAEAAALESHSWYGGSGYICPTYGTLVLQPRIAHQATALAAQFKQAGYEYPEGLFKPQVIEDGVYYIMYNGEYLTNSGDNPDKTGDRPTFTSTLDDIKPARQQWNISLDGETGRYKITSVADGRYINEQGKFWASKTANPYEAAWHTYNIYRRNGKHAIQNGGSAGDKFWTVSGNNVERGTSNAIAAENFLFDIQPIDAQIEYPVIETKKKYYIAYGNQLLTDLTSYNYPVFDNATTVRHYSQLFTFTSDAEHGGRWKIVTAKTNSVHSYINELGAFGTASYSADWNTYILLERDGLWAIQNVTPSSQSNGYRWTVGDDGKGNLRIDITNSIPLEDSYIFEIGTDWRDFYNRTTPVADIIADKPATGNAVYNLSGQRVARPARKGIYIVNGRKVCITANTEQTLQ